MPRRKRDKDGIFDRGDGWLYLQHKGKRTALGTQDRKDAKEVAKRIKNEEADPAVKASRQKRLEDAFTEFREYAETGENRRKPPALETFEMYDGHFAHFLRVWGADTAVGDVNSDAVDEYIASRRREYIGKKKPGPDNRRKVQATTVDKELGTLRQVLRLGLRRGWFHLPLERVVPASAGGEYIPLTRGLTHEQVGKLLAELARYRSPNQVKGGYRGVYKSVGSWESKIFWKDSAGKKQHRYLGSFETPEAAARAYDAAAKEAHVKNAQLNFPEGGDPSGRAAYCAFIVAFGADVVAIPRATLDDMGGKDWARLTVLIRGSKNAKRFDEVPLIGPVFGEWADMAREYLVKHGKFRNWGKERCRDLAAACARAGLPRVTPRDLRRTHAMILAELGLEPHLLGKMLRHADSRMAERTYGHVTRETVGRQVLGKLKAPEPSRI